MVKQYLCCLNLETGVNVLGLLHLNAALFYFWRWTTFVPVYSWFDLLLCLVYVVRTVAYFYGQLMDSMFATVRSRSIYHLANYLSAFAMAVIVTLQIIVYWIDWGHFPVLSFFGWVIIAALNVYHFIILKSFMNFQDQQDDCEEGETTNLRNGQDQY